MRQLTGLLGASLLRVLDVGARGELFPLFLPVASRTEMIGFEPDAEECSRLDRELRGAPWRKGKLLPYAVARAEERRPFYVTEDGLWSSLLAPVQDRETPEGARLLRTAPIETVALDTLYRQEKLGGKFDFLKVDVQGADLEVLKGGEKTILPHLLGVQIEIQIMQHYHDQPTAGEVVRYLEDRGFELVIMDQHLGRRRGLCATRRRMAYCDAVFMRGKKWLQTLDEDERSERLPGLAVIYALYGLFAEAIVVSEDHDVTLARVVRECCEATVENNWRWRLTLLRDFLACAVLPTRERRVRLARKAMTVMPRGDHRWELFHVDA